MDATSPVGQEATFRAVLLLGFVVLVGIVSTHRVRAHGAGEPIDRLQEGIAMLVALRVAGLALWGAVIAYLIQPRWMAWSAVALPTAARWTGVALLAVVAVLLLWTLRSLGKNLTDTVVTRRAHTLVSHGPYRWVRHPFYGCIALMILAIAVTMANLFVLAAGVVVLLLLVIRTGTEEEKLVERFGDDYRDYMRRTPRFVPWRPPGRSA